MRRAGAGRGCSCHVWRVGDGENIPLLTDGVAPATNRFSASSERGLFLSKI